MEPNEIKAFLKTKLPNAIIEVNGSDCNLQVTVISEMFDSMSELKRQQAVFSHLSPFITNGSIHAASIQTFTPQEWKKYSHH